jgi:hypothetical protein
MNHATSDARQKRTAGAAAMAVATAAAVLWAAMSLTYPFGWDQGIFAWAGGVVAKGGLPYRDAWDLKGPLVYYVYALAQIVFGVHLWAIRVLDLLFVAAAAVAVARVTSRFADRSTARWAALFFVLWYASHSFWHTAQPDGWAGMLLIVASAPLVAGRPPRPAHFVILGMAVGLATLTKPLHAALLAPPLAVVVVTTLAGRRATATLALLGGWLLPIATAALWFWSQGALADLVNVHLRYSAHYAATTSGGRLQGLVNDLLTRRVLAVGLPLGLYGAWVLWQTNRAATILFAGFVVVTTGIVVAQNRFFAYHWLPMLPSAVVLGAVGARQLRTQAPVLAVLFVGVLLVHVLAPVGLEEARFARWMAGMITREAYYDGYGPEPGSEMRAVAWLRGQPAGDVFMFGWNGTVPWLAERPVISRFGFSMPLLIEAAPGRLAEYRSEALSAIDTAQPRYIIVGTQSERIIGAARSIADFPALAARIARGYRERAHFGSITIYEATD